MQKITEWLEAQKKLLNAATPGPWSERVSPVWVTNDGLFTQSNGPLCSEKPNEPIHEQASKDAKFIASVRTEHERALKIIEKMLEALDKSCYTKNEEKCDCACCRALAYFPEDGKK